MKSKSFFGLLGVCTVGIVISACGGGGGANVNGLDQLPNMSTLVSSATSTSSYSFYSNYAALTDAPVVADIVAETHFWNGQLASFTNNTYRDEFEIGMGACRMVDGVSRSMDEILRNGTSLCYMKGMTELEDTPVSPSISGANLFAQESDRKLVKVDIANDPFGGGEMDVFIQVYGSSEVSGNQYKVVLYFCESGSATGYESITVNRDTREFTSIGADDGDWGKGVRSVTAKLIGSGSSFGFDPDSDRVAEFGWEGEGDNDGSVAKGKVQVQTDGTVKVWNYYSGEHGAGTFTDKNYAYSQISGSDFTTLKFLQGAYAGKSESTWGSHEYSGAIEYTSYYSATSSGDFYDHVTAYDLDADTFFSTAPSVTVDLTGYDCAATPDYTLTMDFNDPDVDALEDQCESERNDTGYLCDSNPIRTAQDNVYDWGP